MKKMNHIFIALNLLQFLSPFAHMELSECVLINFYKKKIITFSIIIGD